MNKSNRRVFSIFTCIVMTFTFFVSFTDVHATTYATMPSSGKNLRSRPTQNGDLLKFLSGNTKALLLEENVTGENNSGCVPNKWHKVQDLDDGQVGYICAADVAVTSVADVDLNGAFEKEMLAKGFPVSYLQYLKTLHEKHPNWTFNAIKTGLDFNASVDAQYTFGKSLIDGSDTSLRSKDPAVYNSATGEYYNLGWDWGWYAASWNTISYYMDPRNFLNEQYIFMFEQLSYNSSYQTADGVRAVLGSTYMANYGFDYASAFIGAGSKFNISPLHLATRIKQETSDSGSISTTGETFVFSIDNNCRYNYRNDTPWNLENNCGNDKTYSGLYNFYNIGAYGYYMKPAIRGLIWANGGFDGSITSYNRPWNSPEKTIYGGAEYISENYISQGQDTIYFERFNVKPGATNSTYSHQYMTNIRAHSSEAYKNYQTYSKTNSLNNSFEFLIPVYENMPGETSTAPDPTPNPDPGTDVTTSLDTIMGSMGVRYDNTYITNISPGKTVSDLDSDAKRINSSASVSGPSGALGTGNKITISNGKESKEYTVIIYGDANGDGKISIADLLRVQKIILNAVNVSDPYMKAADNNKDGRVTIVDLLRVQKHILGSIVISQ